jgi:uncharacterized MAPEG superfamily protein
MRRTDPSRSNRSDSPVTTPGSRSPRADGSVTGHLVAFAGFAVAVIVAATVPTEVAAGAVVAAGVYAVVRLVRRRGSVDDGPLCPREDCDSRRACAAAD